MKEPLHQSSHSMNRGEFLRAIVGTVVAANVLADPSLAEGTASSSAGGGGISNRMIMDQLAHAEHYFGQHPRFEKAFQFLRQRTLAELAPGKHAVEGDLIYCLISTGPGRKRAEAKLEAHRKYIDIQYIIQGPEEMGWKPTADCKVVDQPYDADKDIAFFKDPPQQWTIVPTGSFALFYPRDAHAPLVSTGEIHKAVVKVAVD